MGTPLQKIAGHESQAEPLSPEFTQERRRVQEMFGKIAHRYDLSNSVLSMGIHHLWRQVLVRMLPPSRSHTVLDLCTGTGDLLPLLSKRFGKVVGADFCRPMLEHGTDKLARARLQGRSVQGDALQLPFKDECFDIVSVSFGVRNFENLERGLLEIRRVLKPGGHLLVLEFGQPGGAFGYVYRWYSQHIMPRIGQFLSGDRHAYEYLPETASRFPAGTDFTKVLAETGYTPKNSRALTMGIAYAYCAQKAEDVPTKRKESR